MEVELFVHGVPSGEGFWGEKEDRNYFGSFYNGSTDAVKFLVQTRKLKDKAYCYYNYLVYRTPDSPTPNVAGNDGRDGSYFGLSLRFDAYCKDIQTMYRILDMVFNICVMGTILRMDRKKLKYKIADFSMASTVITNMEKLTFDLVKRAFSADCFMPLTDFPLNGTNGPSINLYDCTADNVTQAMKQYGKVAVSPYFMNRRELGMKKEYDNKIVTLQQQYKGQTEALKRQYSEQLREKTGELLLLKQKVSQLEMEKRKSSSTIPADSHRDMQSAKKRSLLKRLLNKLKRLKN